MSCAMILGGGEKSCVIGKIETTTEAIGPDRLFVKFVQFVAYLS